MLGLSAAIRACLFDLDGVLTQTASVHAAAWKQMFDTYLKERSERLGEPYIPFNAAAEYDVYVDGKPRADGTRSFLESRGISLPEGSPDDPPELDTVQGLGNRKNQIVLRRLQESGVAVYPGSVRYVRAAGSAGLLRAVVSASANTRQVLAAAGLEHEFDAWVDGVVAQHEQLPGKPAPDTYLAAARMLGVMPAQAAVFEDALAGVAAGRAGSFGLVVGVDRVGQRQALLQHGADLVVDDLAELLDPP